MKILITGANGLVGSAIARRFVEAGWSVFALIRGNSDKTLLRDFAEKITFIEGDILDIPSLETAIEQVDFVVHAAAIVSYSPKDRNKMYKVNIEGTANVVNVCLEKSRSAEPIQKLCFVSSIAALGKPVTHFENKAEILIDENQKWEESPANSHYGKTKYLAECEVWRGEAEGLNVVILNPSMVLGEGDWHKSSTRIFKYVFDENRFYSLGKMNFVDVKDLAEVAFQLTNNAEITGERFILNGGTTTYKNAFEKIADNFHKKRPSRAVNQTFAEIFWRIEAIRSWLTGKEPLITKETAQVSRMIFAYNSGKIQQKINFQFTDLDKTLQRVCKNLVQNQKNA